MSPNSTCHPLVIILMFHYLNIENVIVLELQYPLAAVINKNKKLKTSTREMALQSALKFSNT